MQGQESFKEPKEAKKEGTLNSSESITSTESVYWQQIKTNLRVFFNLFERRA